MLARPARQITELGGAENSFLRMRGNSAAQKGAALSQSSGGAEKLGRSEGSGMLIGDPLVEGSSASSTDGELWRAENSFLGMRGTPLPMRSSRAENSLLRVRPITSSGEWRTHSSEWKALRRSEGSGKPNHELWSGQLIPQNERELTFFLPLLSRKFPPNLSQVKFTVVTGELERNERACLSLTRAFLSP